MRGKKKRRRGGGGGVFWGFGWGGVFFFWIFGGIWNGGLFFREVLGRRAGGDASAGTLRRLARKCRAKGKATKCVFFFSPALTDRANLCRTYGAGLMGRDFCWDEREVESSDRSNGEECVTGRTSFCKFARARLTGDLLQRLRWRKRRQSRRTPKKLGTEVRDECLRDCAIVDSRSGDLRALRGPVHGCDEKL